MFFRNKVLNLLGLILPTLLIACGGGGGSGGNSSSATNPGADIAALTVGAQALDGTVGKTKSNYYSFSVQSNSTFIVELTTFSGDADLGVFTDNSFSAGSLINFSALATPTDVVGVSAAAGETFYIETYGAARSQYQLKITEGPLVHYKFDETQGTTAYNDTHNLLDGTIIGAARVPGKIGNALSFGNSGAHVLIDEPSLMPTADTIFSFPTNKITIEAWIKLDGLIPGSVYQIIGSQYYGLRSFRLQLSSGQVELQLVSTSSNNSWATVITGNQVLSINNWNHIAVTYDGSEAKTYVNGQLDNTQNIIYPITRNYNRLLIGAADNSTFGYENELPGAIDELRIWNTIRTQQEIDAYYQATN